LKCAPRLSCMGTSGFETCREKMPKLVIGHRTQQVVRYCTRSSRSLTGPYQDTRTFCVEIECKSE
jgi:hypothetical protein